MRNDDALEQLLRSHLGRVFSTETGCVAPEFFLREEFERLDASRQEAIEGHARVCRSCAAERVLAAQFDAEPGPEHAEDIDYIVSRLRQRRDEAPAGGKVVSLLGRRRAGQSPRRILPVWGWAAAASVLLAVAAVLSLQQYAGPSLPNLGPQIMRGATLYALEPSGELTGLPERLRWTGSENAISYHVEVSAVDGERLWAQDLTGTSIDVPANLARTLRPAVKYYWRVEGRDEEGRVVAQSGRSWFRALPQDQQPDGE